MEEVDRTKIWDNNRVVNGGEPHQRRRSLPPPRTSSVSGSRSSRIINPQAASPEVISSLISSLESISTPAQSLFDNVPHIGHHTAPVSPNIPQSDLLPRKSLLSRRSSKEQFNSYKSSPEAAHEAFLHPDDAAIPPIVRMAPAPAPTSPRSPRSPRSKTGFGRDSLPPSPKPSKESFTSPLPLEEGDLSGFGIITSEPGPPRPSRAASVASSSSGGKKSLTGPRGLLRKLSKEGLSDRGQERWLKNSDPSTLKASRSRSSLRSKPSMADLTEESSPPAPVPEYLRSRSGGKDSPSISRASSQHSDPNSFPSPGGIGSGRFIPTRESSLRNQYKTSSHKKRRSTRADAHATNGVKEDNTLAESEKATEQTTKRIRELKEQQKKIKSEMETGDDMSVSRTDPLLARPAMPRASTEPPPARRVSQRLVQSEEEPSVVDSQEGVAPSPAVQTRIVRDKKRLSGSSKAASSPTVANFVQAYGGQDRLEKAKWPVEPPSPHSPRTSKQHKRLPSNTASQGGRLSTTEDRPSSADSIDLAVESYVADPRLTQKVRHPRSGRIIAFSEVGDPDGNVVFCCLGMGLTRYLMAFYDELARTLKLRLVTLDRPGVGESQASVDGLSSPLTWPDDIAIVCNHLKVTKFSILAHSAGAIYALATALRIPQHIRGRIHLLAPWIPPSQMSPLGTNKAALPTSAVPYSQRLLRALPTPFLRVANSSFMSATSSSITTSLPKSPKRTRRKSMGKEGPTLGLADTPQGGSQANAASHERGTLLEGGQGVAGEPTDPHAALLAAQAKERQTEYDTRLTYRIWELATTNANPAVDLLVCLERRQTIGFRYTDINREVVIHHGSRDTRVPVDNVRWLGQTMRRCEVRVLEGEGHGLMASAIVMSNVLTEMSREWEDWTMLVQGKRGRRATITHSSRSGIRV